MSEEKLAEYLGLSSLGLGARRAEDDGSRLLAWWWLSVEPSFDRYLHVGALHEEKWTAGPDPDSVSVRGFVADLDGAAVARLETDEGLEALGKLNPFRVAPTHRVEVPGRKWLTVGTADGLWYDLRWATRATKGQFAFGNPRFDWLKEFERVLFRVARQVVTASGAERFENGLARWARYRTHLLD